MSEYISLKMGVNLLSHSIRIRICYVLNIITYKNGENELQFT